MWLALVLLLACAAIAAFVWAARRTVRLDAMSKPTPEEARIHLVHEEERAKILSTAPGVATVKEMSNEELEKLANDRTSLTGQVRGGSSSSTSNRGDGNGG